MKNKKPQLHISLSREHEKNQSEVAGVFSDFDTTFDSGLMRFSSGELPMQVIIFLGTWVASNVAWDFLKYGIKKLYKKFPSAHISIRDDKSIMYTVKPDLTVGVIVTPDRVKSFEHIKLFKDLVAHFEVRGEKNIPEGWSAIPAGEVFTFVKSYAFSRDNLVNDTHNKDGIGSIHYGDIHATFFAPSIDLKKVSVPMIKDASFAPKPEDLLKDGDLIMADASEDYAGVGVTVSLHGLEDKKVVGGLHTFVLRDTKNKTDKYYRQYIFRNPEIRNQMQKVANGVSVYGISKTAVAKLLLPLPPLPEQKRIVSVLEISEKLIKKLSEKIESKMKIKQGLMQELLSGKTRMGSFSGEWHTKELSTLCNISTGKKDVNEGNPNGVYPFFTCAREYTYSDNYSFDMEAILIAGNADVGHCKYYNGKFEAYQRTYVLSRFQNCDGKYLFLFLSHYFKNHVESLKQIGAMSYIKLPMLKEFPVRVPSLDEQKAIADVLTTADKELEQLESKLKILKDQRNYLLNNLITGTIRTPEKLSTHN